MFDYADTIRAAETLFYSNQNPFTPDDRRFMFETADNDLDNFSEMMCGNDPSSYQLGPELPEWNHGIKPADFDDKFGEFLPVTRMTRTGTRQSQIQTMIHRRSRRPISQRCSAQIKSRNQVTFCQEFWR